MSCLRIGKELLAVDRLRRKPLCQSLDNTDIKINRAVIGSLAAGWIADKIGRKFSFAIAFIFSVVGITLEVVATTPAVFFAGKFINGFAIGGFIATSFTYVGEVSYSSMGTELALMLAADRTYSSTRDPQ
jgi:MFS-type transporter involved in bile tolerance (Atg22 family)